MLWFEDFTPGRRFEFTPRPVTTDEIVAFAAEFDPQPMHMSQDGGSESILGGLAASGWHTGAMMMRMLCDSYILDSASEGSPGVDRMEWKKPVLAGDTLSGSVAVLEARTSKSRPSIGIVRFLGEVRNQRGEIVATCDYINMIRRKTEGADAHANG